MQNGGFQEQARKSRSEISPACKAIMYEQYVILYCIVGTPVGDPTVMYAPPLRYKREALTVLGESTLRLTLDSATSSSRLKQYNTQWT